jgi:hypothetical protein
LNVPRNVSMPPVPAAVVAAHERLPKRNPYDIPVHELRNGATSTAWAERFQELMAAEDESIFDVADDDGHKPPGGVGTPLRAAEFAS